MRYRNIALAAPAPSCATLARSRASGELCASGLGSALRCLTQARYGIAWGAVGAALACYDEAVGYATTRETFGRPIGGPSS